MSVVIDLLLGVFSAFMLGIFCIGLMLLFRGLYELYPKKKDVKGT